MAAARPSARRARYVWGLVALLAIGAGATPLLQWQTAESRATRCQSNERRLATALLLYQQDHDSRFPIPDYGGGDRPWRTWMDVLVPYYAQADITSCPANPATGCRNPFASFPYPYSYALNSRFFGCFGPGAFPLDGLEMPAQTALVVESGPRRVDGPDGRRKEPYALDWYWDTSVLPRYYASPHGDRMNVVAADGHVVALKIAHYRPGGHDPLYGRLGGSVFNWNAGHPNGQTGGAPVE